MEVIQDMLTGFATTMVCIADHVLMKGVWYCNYRHWDPNNESAERLDTVFKTLYEHGKRDYLRVAQRIYG